MCGCLSRAPPTGDLALDPGMCPDWESNQRPLGSQASTLSTEPHQPGSPGCFMYATKSFSENDSFISCLKVLYFNLFLLQRLEYYADYNVRQC